jgi:hypothetical protein
MFTAFWECCACTGDDEPQMLIHSIVDESIQTPTLLPRRSSGFSDTKHRQSELKIEEAKVPSVNVESKVEGSEKSSLAGKPQDEVLRFPTATAAESKIKPQDEEGEEEEENLMQTPSLNTDGCPNIGEQLEEVAPELEAELQEAKKRYIQEKRSQSGGLTSRSALTNRSARRSCSRHFSSVEASLVQAADSDASAQEVVDHALEPMAATFTLGQAPVQGIGDHAAEPMVAAFAEAALRGCSCTYIDERTGNRTVVQYRVNQDLTELSVEGVVKRRFALRRISRKIPLVSIMDIDTIENCDFCLPAKVVACLSAEDKKRFSMIFYESKNGAILSFCVLHSESKDRDMFAKSLMRLASNTK